jgi:DNA polymerase-3 subunit epsilon
MENSTESTAKNFFFEVDYVDPFAQKVHGFSRERLKILSGGRRFYGYREEIFEDFKNADLIIAHNLSFDLNFLMKEFEENNMQFLYKQGLCSMRHFTSVCKIMRASGRGYKYPKLSELAEYFGLYPYDTSINTIKMFNCNVLAHDARYDTTMLYLSLKNALAKNNDFREFVDKYI